MNAGAGGQGGDDKSSTNILWAIAGIFVVTMLVWHFFGNYLIKGFLWVRIWEMKAIGLFTDKLSVLQEQVQFLLPEEMTFERAEYISQVVGSYLAVPMGLFLGIIALIVMTRHTGVRFNKNYDMELLLNQEKKNWPQVAPVSKLRLISESIDAGKWAMAMPPINFCKKMKIVDVELVPDTKAAWKREPMAKATLKKDLARRIFASQLGPHFTSVEDLPIHIKALYAVYSARIGRDQKAADALLAQISLSSSSGKLDFSGTKELLNKYGYSKEAQKVTSRHAYVVTVMMSMLATARNDGVIPSSTFLWLKPVDRRLWYALNCVGRQVAFTESAGPFAHWKVEVEMGRALNAPFIEEAVKSVEVALTEIVYTPSEEEMQKLIEEHQNK